MIIPNIWKHKKCSKPPTSNIFNGFRDCLKHDERAVRPLEPSDNMMSESRQTKETPQTPQSVIMRLVHSGCLRLWKSTNMSTGRGSQQVKPCGWVPIYIYIIFIIIHLYSIFFMILNFSSTYIQMAVCQNLVPLVNIKIAGKWMFIPLKMVLIGIDPYPYPNLFNTFQP